MKTRVTLIAVALVSSFSFSQEKQTYEFVKLIDDPNSVADKIVSMTAVGSFGKNTDISVGVESDVLWGLTDRLAAFGNVAYLPVNFSDFSSFDLGLGATYTFGSKTKTKETKIVLKWSDSGSTSSSYNSSTGGTTETTTRSRSATYLVSDAVYLRKYKIRGGVYSNRSAYEGGAGADNQPLFMTGVFGGFEFSTQAAVVSEVDGTKGVTSGLTRIYADALLAPIHNINKVGQGFGIGAKAGFCVYMLPNKAKNAKPESLAPYQAYNSMFFKAEVGVRPSQGWMFTMGGGIMLFRNK